MNIYRLFGTVQTNPEEELYCVYCHQNKINGKRYIGQTISQENPCQRWGSNGKNYARCYAFYNAIKKYGWDNFDHYVIQDNLTKEQANELEILNIAFYNTTDRRFGYNISSGGSDGHTVSEEGKQKISKSMSNRMIGNSYTTNYVWVNKDNVERRVPISQIYEFTKMGFEFGRTTTHKVSDQHKDYLKKKMTNNSYTKGKIWVNKDGKHKVITPDKLQEYIDLGYTKGKIPNNKEKIWVHKGDQSLFILPEKLQDYELLGYVRGRK